MKLETNLKSQANYKWSMELKQMERTKSSKTFWFWQLTGFRFILLKKLNYYPNTMEYIGFHL